MGQAALSRWFNWDSAWKTIGPHWHFLRKIYKFYLTLKGEAPEEQGFCFFVAGFGFKVLPKEFERKDIGLGPLKTLQDWGCCFDSLVRQNIRRNLRTTVRSTLEKQ